MQFNLLDNQLEIWSAKSPEFSEEAPEGEKKEAGATFFSSFFFWRLFLA